MDHEDQEFVVARCPACGQRLEDTALERCPLCGFNFGIDRAATSDDTTPFARAFSQELGGHRQMWKWVLSAPAGRIKHLGLMRVSAAAKSFSRLYWLLLAAAMGLLLGTHYGWRPVTGTPSLEPTGSVRPQGRGWLHVAATPNPYRITQSAATPIDLWWSPPQAVVAGVTGFVGGVVLLGVLFAAISVGVRLAHKAHYRGEGRMTAALHYSTAWSVPLLIAGLLLLFRAIARVGEIARWSWYPAASGLEFLAGLVGVVTFVFWWFWLLRLGSSAPADTRTRVEWFLGLGVPLLVAWAGATWWYGIEYVLTRMFTSWKLGF